jgi:hypothetical protein
VDETPKPERVKTTIELDKRLNEAVRVRCVELEVPIRFAIEEGLYLWLKKPSAR